MDDAARDDVFELLLPRAPAEERQRARRLSTFLRLLLDDAQGLPAEVVGGSLGDARVALDDVTREELLGALTDLLVWYLRALRGPDSFVELPEPVRPLDGAWWVVLECGAARRGGAIPGGVPGLPRPGEPVSVTLERLLAALATWGGDAELWSVRVRHVLEGPRSAETELLRLRTATDPAAPVRRRAELEVELALARLGRGRPREAAGALLGDALTLVTRSPRLARLAVWALVASGRAAEAAELGRGFAETAGRLPAPLSELVQRRPALAPLLRGRPDAPADATARALEVETHGRLEAVTTERLGWGASAVLWVRLGPAHTPEVLHADVGPALRERVEGWRRGRDGAARRIGEPEHRLLSTAQPVVLLRDEAGPDGASLRGALDPRGARALALVPSLGRDGEVEGWLHVECEHLLLPSQARLAAAVRELARSVATHGPGIAGAERAGRAARVGEPPSSFGTSAGRAVPPRTALAGEGEREARLGRAAKAAVDSLGLALRRRGWCWYDVDPAGSAALRLVAHGGVGSAPGRPGRAALRAAHNAVPVLRADVTDGTDEAGGVRSELAVPLRDGARVLGVFVLWSRRARDLGEREAQHFAGRLEACAPAWRAARFAAWHRRHFGEDVHLELTAASWRPLASDVQRLVRLGTPLALVGPAGAGKQVLARWLAFERDEGPPHLVRWRTRDGGELEPGAVAPRDVLLLEGAERLEGRAAERAADALTHASRQGALVLATARRWPREATGPRARLAARLRRVVLSVPGLARRRDELPGLLAALVAGAAREEGLAPAVLTDRAVALLWRQPWEENVRELERFALRLTALHPGRTVGPDEVQHVAERLGQQLTQRLPSRHPRREDVEAALAVTRKLSGAWNKTRAARYLGWDPDTLVRRLRDLGLGAAPGNR